MGRKDADIGRYPNPSEEPRPIRFRPVPAPSNLAPDVMSRIRRLPVLIGGRNPSGNNGGGSSA